MTTATLPLMTFPIAAQNFRAGMQHAHNIVDVHRAAGGPGRGRRTRESSLNRAIVLMAVASWQALVEDLVFAAFRLRPSVTKGETNSVIVEVGKFATPSAEKVKGLIARHLGTDPSPAWTWSRRGGQGRPTVVLDDSTVSATLDSWVKLRHAVAHGHDSLFMELPTAAVDAPAANARLVSKRLRTGKSTPTLTLTDAVDCLRFFNSLAEATGGFMTSTFSAPSEDWRLINARHGIA